MSRVLHLVGAATSAGAHGPGQERAPAAFREHGVVQALTVAGWLVEDHGDVVDVTMRPDPEHPRLRQAEDVASAARVVARHVRESLTADPDSRVLVLGGDCTVQLGVVAGAKAATRGSVGLAYLDLDCDLTSPADGNGFADWMGVTHLLDAPDADPRLAALDGSPPLLTPDTIRLVAADLATEYEAQRLRDLALTRYSSRQVESATSEVVGELAAWADGLDLLSVHVDVDVLDQTAFPIAEEQRDTPGLRLSTLGAVVGGLMRHPAARILTVCEVNPTRPPSPRTAFEQLNGLIVSALAGC